MGEAIAKIFVAWLATFGSAFEPSGRSDRKKTRSHVLGRGNGRQHWPSSSQLFGNGSRTNPSIVAGNREYLAQTLGFDEDRLDNISARKEWNFLTLETGVLKERVHWLTTRLDLKENEMKKIAKKSPSVLGRKPEESLAPKLQYLQTRLLLDDESMRKIILRTPTILGHSTEDNIEPKLDWLQQRLNLDDVAVGKMIRICPQLLHCSVDANIEPTLNWLQRRLDLGEAAVSKMIQTYPNILNLNVGSIEPKINWLQQRLNLNNATASIMIQKFPALLGYSIDANLRPTLNFYVDALGVEEEVLDMLSLDPSLFGYSLKNRLKPRLEEAQDAGVTIDSGCLKRIAKYTTKQWNMSMDN